jgi:hypothetical protein
MNLVVIQMGPIGFLGQRVKWPVVAEKAPMTGKCGAAGSDQKQAVNKFLKGDGANAG